MSGHSKWSTIKRAKGATDVARGKTFSKLSRVITLAVKKGGTDPDLNPTLRTAVEKAHSYNMPKENIERAIDRGLGKLPGQVLEEVFYEGFGPGKIAFYLEGVTDNRLRTNQEIRNLFEKSGGTLGGSGSVSYMFDKKGEIVVKGKGGGVEEEILELIDLGADDVEDQKEADIQKYLVYTESPELNTMGTKITQAGYEIESSEIIYKPNVMTEIIDAETINKIIGFIEKLEEHDDIHKVYTNLKIAE